MEGCANHPREPSAARCASCSRPHCRACVLRTVDGSPWCEVCVHHLETAGANRWPRALLLVGSAFVAAMTGSRIEARTGDEPTTLLWFSVLGLSLVVAVLDLGRKPVTHGRKIVALPPEESLPTLQEPSVGQPYRARLTRVVRVLAPPLSGRATVLVLLACMALPALALPRLLGLSRVLEIELVVLTWWGVWTVALAVLLYRGFRLSDDHVFRWPRFARKRETERPRPKDKGSTWWDAPFYLLEAGWVVALAGLIVAALFGAAWVVVELLLPALFFLAYWLVRGALARVANDNHDCEGHGPRSLGWAALFATLYMLPLALILGVVAALWPILR